MASWSHSFNQKRLADNFQLIVSASRQWSWLSV